MDVKKIGQFLAELRKEKRYTQEELGGKLRVSNKTISRWENGNYLPPVEMLQLLSEEYAVSLNELLSGERLSNEDYKEKAEENMKSVLKTGRFSLEEKVVFWKKKWLKEHIALMLCCFSIVVIVFLLGIFFNKSWIFVAIALCFLDHIILYNKMMAFVEKNAYDGTGLLL